MSICHATTEEQLRRKLEIAHRKIEILEGLIGDQQRLILDRSEELESAVQENSECRVREGLLFDLIEHANESFFAIDPFSGLIIEANSTAARCLGYTRQKLRQATVQDIEMKLETLDTWRAHSEALKERDEGMVIEGIHQRKDGSSFPVEVYTRYVERNDRSYIIACARDITKRKQAEARLAEAKAALLEASRKAGMADVASSILHNVGNVLNSLIVNTVQLGERVQNSEVSTLLQVKELIKKHSDNLEDFVQSNPKSVKLLRLVERVADSMVIEQKLIQEGVNSVKNHLEHIRSIVARQQEHARAAGVVEELPLEKVVEDAIEIGCGEFASLGIRLVRSFYPTDMVKIDRNKVVEILVNLVSNAKHAVLAQSGGDKLVEILLRLPTPDMAEICVKDNGIGLAPDHLSKIFEQGFTTKPQGNGLGLHASAIGAKQMGGTLSCKSQGLGQGASFSLTIPTGQG